VTEETWTDNGCKEGCFSLLVPGPRDHSVTSPQGEERTVQVNMGQSTGEAIKNGQFVDK
jgi:hypothetical protein